MAWADFGDGTRYYFATGEITADARVSGKTAGGTVVVPAELGKGRFTVVARAEIGGEVVENKYSFAIEER